jgi:hypothetical protein
MGGRGCQGSVRSVRDEPVLVVSQLDATKLRWGGRGCQGSVRSVRDEPVLVVSQLDATKLKSQLRAFQNNTTPSARTILILLLRNPVDWWQVRKRPPGPRELGYSPSSMRLAVQEMDGSCNRVGGNIG